MKFLKNKKNKEKDNNIKYIFLSLFLIIILLVFVIPNYVQYYKDMIDTNEEKEIANIAKDIYFAKKLQKECGIVRNDPIAISLISNHIYSVKLWVDIRNCPDADKWGKHCIYILVDNSTRKEFLLAGTQVEPTDCKRDIISKEDKDRIYNLIKGVIDKK